MATKLPFVSVERLEIGPAAEASGSSHRTCVTIMLAAYDGGTTWINLTAKVETPPLDQRRPLIEVQRDAVAAIRALLDPALLVG
jgi:hypothetical protein